MGKSIIQKSRVRNQLRRRKVNGKTYDSLSKLFHPHCWTLCRRQLQLGQNQKVIRNHGAPNILFKPSPSRPITTRKPKRALQPGYIRLDHRAICFLTDLNDRLGFETGTVDCSMAVAFEAYEKGLLTREDTDGLELRWGDARVVETLLRKIVRREG